MVKVKLHGFFEDYKPQESINSFSHHLFIFRVCLFAARTKDGWTRHKNKEGAASSLTGPWASSVPHNELDLRSLSGKKKTWELFRLSCISWYSHLVSGELNNVTNQSLQLNVLDSDIIISKCKVDDWFIYFDSGIFIDSEGSETALMKCKTTKAAARVSS